MAVFAWGHMMHEQDACSSFGAKLQCWKGRIGETYIGVSRGPQTLWPSGQRWKPEITPLGVPQTSVHGRVVSKEFSRLFSRPFGSIPCVASSATTWVNLPNVGGQPTRMYQVRQWACNRHFGYGRTSALQYRLKSSTRVTLSSLSGTITGLRWKGRRFSSFYQIRQWVIWTMKAGILTFGMWDINERYLLLHHRGAVLRGMWDIF